MNPENDTSNYISVCDLLGDVVLKDTDPIILGPMCWSDFYEFMFSLDPGTTVSTQHRNDAGLWGSTFVKIELGFGRYIDDDCVTRCSVTDFTDETVFETISYIPIES